jgi:hypothetical protein
MRDLLDPTTWESIASPPPDPAWVCEEELRALPQSAISACVVDKLMDSLVRHSEQTGSITSTHFQLSAAQHPHGASRREGRAPVFPIGLLTQRRVQTDRLRSWCRQPNPIDEFCRPRIVNKQLHSFPNAAPRFVHGPALRVAAAHLANRSYPPTRLVSFVSDMVSAHEPRYH